MGLQKFRAQKSRESYYVNVSIISCENNRTSRERDVWTKEDELFGPIGISSNNSDYVINPRYTCVEE